MSGNKVLLVNPWIYDFAAFDMWSRPIGLLYIGGLLRANGYHISLINCLDRYNPELLKYQNLDKPKNNEHGCGKFYKEIIEKPSVLKDVPRKYGRYGLPIHLFRKELANVEKPDVILVTSGMTYWYMGVFDAIKEAKSQFPGVPVILGGTYATLCYDHAVKNSGADYVVCGEGELKALELIRNLTSLNPPSPLFQTNHCPQIFRYCGNKSFPPFKRGIKGDLKGLSTHFKLQNGGCVLKSPLPPFSRGRFRLSIHNGLQTCGQRLVFQRGNLSIDDYPYPVYDLLTNKESLAILTSRGCPMGCTYCASSLVAGEFRQRDPIKVVDEIEYYHKTFGTKNFAFYDDALLLNSDEHISVILKEVIRRNLDCYFHTPNAMHANHITKSLAQLMFKSGFKTIRISLETSNVSRQREIGNKVSTEGFQEAVINLKEAGYKGKDIGVYVLICLPGQPLDEMIQSVRYVYECGAVTKLAVYSPIPNTDEWKKAVEQYGLDPNADPLLHNNSICPIRSDGIKIDDIQKVKTLALEYNNKIGI